MMGLEKVYSDLYDSRKRLTKLIQMERLPLDVGENLIIGVFRLMKDIEFVIESGVEVMEDTGWGEDLGD